MSQERMSKPADSQWTDDQWKAIVSSGQDILVAAAAGSGKTAVLVERIIRKIIDPENPVDVDRLLVVTFTNASAAEMRHRIGEALEKELKVNPSSLHLRRQLHLLNRSSISTLHSFCLEVIRTYYYMINLDPGFRIADDTEAELLREEVLDELFEEQYSLEGNQSFFELVDRYTSDRHDLDVQHMVGRLYDFARSNPNPNRWLDMLLRQYSIDEEATIDSLPFMSFLMGEVKKQLSGVQAMLNQASRLTTMPGGPAPRKVNIEDDLAQVNRMLAAGTFAELHEHMQVLSFTRLKPCKGDEYDVALLDEFGELRKKAKAALEKLQGDLFSRPLSGYMSDFQKMYPVVEVLVSLVRKFGNRYEAEKRAKGLVDFSDLEHYCLQILSHSVDGRVEPSEVAYKYKTQFVEVLVDEYQDTNMVQETIIQLVTHNDGKNGNLFMVGDVKQSIYRFRLAEPFLFLGKYKTFTHDGRKNGMKIDLNKNFRSRSEIIDATNFIFQQLMDEEVGEIAYDNDASLKLGASYPSSSEMESELLLISKEGGAEEEESDLVEFSEAELETAQLEARAMARKIKQLVQDRFQVYDRKLDVMRNVTYRDFVILLRSMPWAPQIMEEFKQEGIPVYADLSSGYFDATEVMMMMSLLKVIDNPYQDIPLASVLRSPIVGLSDEELALIRAEDKKGTYYEAMKNYVRISPEGNLQEKLHHFAIKLSEWRTKARQTSLSTLIWQIYRDTGFYEFVGGLPGGKQRQANLRALYDRARQYEATSFRGLFRFLRFIDRMKERGNDLGTARSLGEQEDVVRLMTIHSSKGLEFPIVFVAGLNRKFNLMDLNKSYILDKELGFGSKYIDPKLRITYPTLLQQVMKQKMKKESIAEEMRVLYVALTRAKEKLILVGTVKDAEAQMKKWSHVLTHDQWELPAYMRVDAKSYLDWIGLALARHRHFEKWIPEEQRAVLQEVYEHSSKWEIQTIQAAELSEQLVEEQLEHEELLAAVQKGDQVHIESIHKERIEERLRWEYGHLEATTHRSKQSVSDLKRQYQASGEEQESQLITGFKSTIEDRPAFMQSHSLTAAERGTAVHTVMQHLPFKGSLTIEAVQELIDSLVTNEILTTEQAESINPSDIAQFTESFIGQQLKEAEKVYREMPFSLNVSTEEVYGWNDNEAILVQGIIDCLYEWNGQLILVDYKTDDIKNRFSNDFNSAEEILKNRYEVQLKLYRKAVETIVKKPIAHSYLYFLDGGHVIEIEE
ncbi:helicase-exonuclease AddAB subunit AddA [Priestia flexa]|uniref:helicase-exonuclease AddAB subunit AddA n=1 Tax=Priestia flexa TaxID=86664 RepID=UPI000C2439D0|nr:helicase-exonuclease AddAB subunit AddA [Priestia flexa]MEC0664980.1 helicase-exonuclease AddAB subunit AddA [Priestia flexa]